MTVCYFGFFRPDYVRNRVLQAGLRQQGVKVIACGSRGWGVAKFWQLLRQHRRLPAYQAMVVGFPGHQVMPLARWLAKRRHAAVVFDAFTSQYQSMVEARAAVRPRTLRASYYYLLDWWGCRLADAVLLDTQAHVEYLTRLIRLPRERCHAVFVSTDIADLPPARVPAKPAGRVLVHWHGHYAKFQGADVIVRAAKLLAQEPVHCRMIGRGPGHAAVAELARQLNVANVTFVPDVDYPTLAEYIKQADLCLGVFGGGRPRPVIPNKVVEAMALGKPVISAHLPAMDELFTADVHLAYCRSEDPQDLARGIDELRRNPAKLQRLGQAGHQLFQERLTPAAVGRQLKQIIDRVVSSRVVSGRQ